MWYIVLGYMIFSSGSCIIQRWHIVKNSDKMPPCSFSWLRLKPSMGVSQSFAPGQTAGTPVLCSYVYLWTHFVYFSYSFISLWCLLLRLPTIWVFQPVQQPFCLPILVTCAVFSLFILPAACYLLRYRDQFLKRTCLFLFDILKHNNICPVCWTGCRFHCGKNNDFCSSGLQAMWTQLYVCDCIQLHSESCSYWVSGVAVHSLDSEQFIWKSPMLVFWSLVTNCSPLLTRSVKTLLF